ncbi:MAG: nucleotide exchange factor GrpE [Bacteroidales bacterium]|nr:nucleotide exchange factor GrpE [Bacteroidales bacterium]
MEKKQNLKTLKEQAMNTTEEQEHQEEMGSFTSSAEQVITTLTSESSPQQDKPETISDNETTPDEPLEEPLKLAQKEAEEWKDKYIRLLAEFENYKKRIRQEKHEWQKAVLIEFIKNLLPILDDLERGLKVMEDSNENQIETFKNGYEIIHNKFLHVLKQYGLEPIDEVVEFNTDLHEAISTIENPEMKGKIIEVVEKGYKLEGKVIRFAKVIVGN